MALAALLAALTLPLLPAPQSPFPSILSDAATITAIAPGVRYGDYQMRTAGGPLSVHVLAVDLREPGVRLGTALANDTLVSSGETLSSMARRTGAVAGINADYFDINQTNQPLNLLVRAGRLIRAPMQRPVLAIRNDRSAFISEFTVNEFAQLARGRLPLATMNDWPPRGSAAALITPDYGELRAAPGVTLAPLQTLGTTPPLTAYRVAAIESAGQPHRAGAYLAFGPQFDAASVPSAGDEVTIGAQATPSLDDLVSAVGGGPLLVSNGAWFADPHGPSEGEFATHMPASGAALTAGGTLLLFEIDGRQPAFSVGVLQPQLAALMIAFGAQTGMQFDGGGSSTIVARLPGENVARVLNSPSDGSERHIADALLVYSDAPIGPAVALVTRPAQIRAVPGARISVLAAKMDSNDHTIRTLLIPYTAGKAGDTLLHIARDGLRRDVPVHVAETPARLQIDPPGALALPGERLRLQARAFDAQGYELSLPAELRWDTDSGTIGPDGVFVAGATDAHVVLHIGAARVQETVTVGEHEAGLAFVHAATFATAPQNGPGGIDTGAPCPACLRLRYDFSGSERAAYANVSLPLAQRAAGLSMDVLGDGNAETLRVAVTNAINERFLYTIARVDWSGWKHVEVRFPTELPQPIMLRSLYVVGRIGTAPAVRAAGSVVLRAVREVLAGSAQSVPK